MSPGYDEGAQLALSSLQLPRIPKQRASLCSIVQKLAQPAVDVFWSAGMVCFIDMSIDRAMVSAPERKLSAHSLVVATWGVLYFYMLQVCLIVAGVILVRLNICLGSYFNDTVDYLATTPLPFLKN